MMTRSTSKVLAPALLATGALLLGADAVLRPGHAGAWAAAAGVLAVMAFMLWRTPDRAAGGWAHRNVRDGVALAAAIVDVALGLRLADAFGMHPQGSLALRVTMLATAAFLVFTGNELPKVLVPAGRHADLARVEACRRVAGWTGVLTGIVLAIVWVALPIDAAMVASLVTFGVAAIVLVWQLGIARRRGQAA
ncbi:MAG TPA: hypothetical protein VFK69_11745 [Candidatus Eisenbacteria bacterium]|nr:hypothetical protein [Candidatus Eisenbacteria bacterium]